jgi:hypothetical protein
VTAPCPTGGGRSPLPRPSRPRPRLRAGASCAGSRAREHTDGGAVPPPPRGGRSTSSMGARLSAAAGGVRHDRSPPSRSQPAGDACMLRRIGPVPFRFPRGFPFPFPRAKVVRSACPVKDCSVAPCAAARPPGLAVKSVLASVPCSCGDFPRPILDRPASLHFPALRN